MRFLTPVEEGEKRTRTLTNGGGGSVLVKAWNLSSSKASKGDFLNKEGQTHDSRKPLVPGVPPLLPP